MILPHVVILEVVAVLVGETTPVVHVVVQMARDSGHLIVIVVIVRELIYIMTQMHVTILEMVVVYPTQEHIIMEYISII